MMSRGLQLTLFIIYLCDLTNTTSTRAHVKALACMHCPSENRQKQKSHTQLAVFLSYTYLLVGSRKIYFESKLHITLKVQKSKSSLQCVSTDNNSLEANSNDDSRRKSILHIMSDQKWMSYYYLCPSMKISLRQFAKRTPPVQNFRQEIQ